MFVSNEHRPLAVCVMGPTGVGKTALAAELVSRLSFSIISVDSAMVYRGLDIGTAKPDPNVLARAPHRLIDICDPTDPYSAARFRVDALREMREISRNGRIPLLVGGTGLYFRALYDGLCDLPSAHPQVRRRLQAESETIGWRALHARLAEVDPDAAATIHPNDRQRVQRALEVYEISGRTMTQLSAIANAGLFPYRLIKFILAPADRCALHEGLEVRFREMLERGLVDEVRNLKARGFLNGRLPATRLVGYRQVGQYLANLIDWDTMIEGAIIATRQLAKRQLTWFRSESSAVWIDSQPRSALNAMLHSVIKALT